MYKYKNGLLPKSYDDMLGNFKSIHKFDTRHKKNYIPQNHKIKTILCSGPKVWNTLPTNIQNASNINPRLPEPFFVTRLPKGGWLPPPPKIFAMKPPILMILVLEDRYEPLPSIDTKKVPVALHLTSQ